MTPKEKRERAFFLKFLKTIPELEKASWVQGDKPDFIVSTAEGTIGIEVTEVLVSSELKARENLEAIIVRKAQEEYHRHSNGPLLVNVLFKTRLNCSKADAALIGDLLGQAILDQARMEQVGSVEQSQLPEKISKAIFAVLNPGARPVWGTASAAFSPEIEAQALRDAIRKKDVLVPVYLKSGDEVWLLIAIEGFRGSTQYSVEGEALQSSYSSKFDRVYILDFQKEQSFRLT